MRRNKAGSRVSMGLIGSMHSYPAPPAPEVKPKDLATKILEATGKNDEWSQAPDGTVTVVLMPDPEVAS